MERKDSLMNQLQSLKDCLQREKIALIENKGEELRDIVAAKEALTAELESASLPETNKDEYIPVIDEIRQLQEGNLLLTQQAMSFTDAFLQSLQESVKKEKRGYSKKGKYQENETNALFDQQV
ncbi:flagellar protein FlgN [Lacticigenium naphthae]|uniref:flagellar protein FlgN n=1 Tax=Lacticigenium naphthae TaxID=515351 RepID=UPI000405B1AE|nr:flagellar protein FlgN [Lacticigenium naphthae]